MNNHEPIFQPTEEIEKLLTQYKGPQVCAADILCDRHPATQVACTIIQSDLSAIDITYGELRTASEALASGFQSLGLKAGDRIATLMGKSRDYLITVMAIWRLGAVHVPLFTAFATPAITMRTTASNCKLIICDPSQHEKLSSSDGMPNNEHCQIVTTGQATATSLGLNDLLTATAVDSPLIAAVAPSDSPLIQIYTSGTTGQPKGITVPIQAIASFQCYLEFGLGVSQEDVYWNAADPGWAYGLYYAIIAPLAAGVKTHLLEGGFSPEIAFKVLTDYKISNFAAAPTVYRALQASDIEAPTTLYLRSASSAGEPLTPDVNLWAEKALGVSVHDHYGQTETGMTINNHHHPALKKPIKAGSMGHSLPGWTAAVLKEDQDTPAEVNEQGRVAIDLLQSPLAWFEGYVNEPIKSAERFSKDQRWYLTGDAGSIDEEGYFHFASRDDDIIIMAGYRIGPFEVESVLCMHEAVTECAAVAAPDKIRGEVLEAFVVLAPEYTPSADLTQELQHWVKAKFAAHAYPRQLHYVESLPKTPSGKVQRFELRKQLQHSK